MASRAFFDPITFLRLAPAISTTASLLYAYDQHFFLSIFTRPENRAESNRFLPSYFKTFFNKAVWVVVGFLALTVGTSTANLRLSRALLEKKGSYPWYVAAAAMAVGHLAYVPLVAPKIVAIFEDQSKGNATKDLDAWLRLNAIRGWTTDLAAWGCALVAVVKTFAE